MNTRFRGPHGWCLRIQLREMKIRENEIISQENSSEVKRMNFLRKIFDQGKKIVEELARKSMNMC